MGSVRPVPPKMPSLLPMLTPMIVLFGSRQVLDFEDPATVEMCRITYYTINVALLIFLGYLYTRARVNDAEGLVKTKEKRSLFEVEPEDGTDEMKVMSIKQYDVLQVWKGLQKTVVGMVVTTLICWKWSLSIPFVLQSVTGPMQMYQSTLFKVYMLGKRQKRPWDDDNKPGSLMSSYNDMKKQMEDAQRQANGLPPRKAGKERRAAGLSNKKKLRQRH